MNLRFALVFALASHFLLAACSDKHAFNGGDPPTQTVAANPAMTVTQTGDLSNTRTSLWGKWQGQAVSDAAVAYFGKPAKAEPLPAQTNPNHPWLAAQGNNSMHGGSYSSKVMDWPAPLGNNPQVRGKSFGSFFGGECATVVFDSKGRIMSVCATLLSFKLYLIDANSLAPLAQYDLPLRDSNKTLQIRKIISDTSGGAYFHLLKGDRPLIVSADNVLRIFVVDESSGVPVWKVEKSWDLQAAIPKGQQVTDAMPDWAGNYWFITRQGLVGVLNPNTGKINTLSLPKEEIENSFSVAEDGVYIVTDRALYRFESDAEGKPRWTWREVYDNDRQPKPGVIGLGSGSTPTLLGRDYVAITDHAGPRMHVVVYRRRPDWKEARQVCAVPVFAPNRSITDNGLIGYGNSLIATNTYGYDTPTHLVWTTGGVARVDVKPNGKGCKLAWSSPEAAQTVLAKMSTKTGLVYIYTREPVPGFDPKRDAAYAWYFTALDYATGQTRFKVLTGTGLNYNNNWAPITLSPWGRAYVGVLGGLVSIEDGPGSSLIVNHSMNRSSGAGAKATPTSSQASDSRDARESHEARASREARRATPSLPSKPSASAALPMPPAAALIPIVVSATAIPNPAHNASAAQAGK